MTYDLRGYKTGTLTVMQKHSDRTKEGRTQWVCKCLCGNTALIATYRLTDVNLKRRQESCGRCEWHIKHKEAYTSWMGMKQRCNDTECKDYKNYGGRGITYESRWEKFTEFYIDMGDPPYSSLTGERLSLDRENVNGNYKKSNCVWSTRAEQQTNKR